jgi:hypothetical protein
MGDIEGENLTSYDVAIAQTKYCFAEDAVGRMKGYFITIIPAAGNEFVAGVRSHEPLAMFVLLYFGVLVDRASRDPMMWLLGSAGRDFVAETSRLVMLSDIAGVEGVVDGVAWARGEVGLPPLGACVDSLPED